MSCAWRCALTTFAIALSALINTSPLAGQQWAVTVWPLVNGFTAAAPLNSSNNTVVWVVQNTGTIAEGDDYTLTCRGTGGITCGTVTPSTVHLAPSDTAHVTVQYSVGSTVGNLWFKAAGVAVDSGDITITANPSITLVVPVLTSGSRAVVHNRQPLIRALFTTNGSPVDTTKTKLVFRSDTVTTLARANRGLIEWDVDSARWIAVGDSALISVTACAQNSVCSTVTRWAVLPADNKPVLGFTGVPLEALGRQFGAPFGPGFSVSGAEIEAAIGTPAYVSMGASRSAGLVYSTRQSYPRALVPVDLEVTWPAGTPDQIKVLLWDGAVKLDSVTLTSPTCATGSSRRCRTVLQGDFSASSFATPTRKWLTAEVRVTSGGTTQTATDSVEVVLVDRRTTRYGSGWWPAGVLQLVQAGSDRIVVGPSGAAAIYRGNGDSLYLSPPGDFTVLTKPGSTWELAPRGSTAKIVFDANGRLVRALDANGNKDSIVYNGSTDQVTSLRDAVGKTITFGYDGNSKISTFTDPAGRQTLVSVNGATNQLTYDSVPSPTSKPYTRTFVYTAYATNTVVMTKQVGVLSDTTTVTYDSTFRRRPTQVTLPLVQDETGTNVNPVVQYTAVERQGWQSVRSLDSVYVELKDPRTNWTRSLVNRWGQARKTWDALGLLQKTEFTSEGFALSNEGKNGDSSRVYHHYDNLRHLVADVIVRSSTDTFKMDSLVYDSNHRVIQLLRHTTSFFLLQSWLTTYDTHGNVLTTITPNSDTTWFWYRSDGLLDSTRAPGNTHAQVFSYDATFKNAATVKDENGNIVNQLAYDSAGRTISAQTGARHVRTGTADSVWYGRTETFFTLSNQVDSTRVMQTPGDCFDLGCPLVSWPDPTDTVLTQRVGYRFDRAGRDSLRLNDRGKATMYLYDRLGRLVSRRPFTDSMAIRDSMVYDIAGNLRRSITRRGDTITTTYDSRNRDTATVVPGVGTLRRAFAGPLDQVTRVWIDFYVDSIGGVNPEVRRAYDQRGRLIADTTYTGSTGRGTAYSYDNVERVSSVTDPLGTWTMRYEGKRAYLDSIYTPFGDTLKFTYDGQGRTIGPYWLSSGPQQSRVPVFSQVGQLKTLTHTVSTSQSYVAGKWDRVWNPDSSGPPLLPQWTEQHGSGQSTVTISDSSDFDGWGRLIAWIERKDGVLAERDTFRFDRTGNIRTTAGAETYDAATGRLLSRTDGGGTWSYTYDRAGNLLQASQAGVTWAYTYDALNRLTAVRRSSTLIARYAYDVQGRRIVKRVYSAASGGIVAYTRFVYRGANVGFDTDSSGTIGLKYVWGGTDDLLSVHDAAGNHYAIVQDLLHNVRGVVKRDGTWVLSQRFGPYGNRISADSSGSGLGFELRYRWTGREYDSETGWYFFRARYLDSGARRFVQEDPIGYSGGASLYAYGDGNPLAGRDPAGNRFIWSMYFPENETPDPEWQRGGGTGVDPFGQNEDWTQNSNYDYANGEQHIVTICIGSSCTSTIAVIPRGTENVLELAGLGYERWLNAGGIDILNASGRNGHEGEITAWGFSVTLMTAFGGGSITVGQYLLYPGQEGSFTTIATGQGIDFSIGMSLISSPSFDAFNGRSSGSCVGAAFASWCLFSNRYGQTNAVGLSLSVTDVLGLFGVEVPGLWVSGWEGTSDTHASPPVRRSY